MPTLKNYCLTSVAATLALGWCTANQAADITHAQAQQAVSAAVLPAMQKHHIPGMAVALVVGEQSHIFNYGVADVAAHKPVADTTIFEVGSISKTFTAALATHAQALGKLQLSDPVAQHLPQLAGTDFGRVPLLHLATHTAGGVALQVPDSVHNKAQLLAYWRTWKPAYPTGTMRTYANPSIGTLGWIAAQSVGQDFSAAMHHALLQPLGLHSTYLQVPAEKMGSYAWGYDKDQQAVRVNPGVLDSEAYGIKTTAADLATFLQAHMGILPVAPQLQTALRQTHQGHFQVGPMTQALIWESYAMPTDVQTLQAGNANAIILNPTPVTTAAPATTAAAAHGHVWINKTGATNGFGAYVAFVPAQRFGVVLLANKNYPNVDRVALAHDIYRRLHP